MHPDREIHVEKLVCQVLEHLGFRCYKLADSKHNGFPDRTIIAPNGGICFVEFKHPSGAGSLSRMQTKRIAELQRNKCKVAVHNDAQDAIWWVYRATGYTPDQSCRVVQSVQQVAADCKWDAEAAKWNQIPNVIKGLLKS